VYSFLGVAILSLFARAPHLLLLLLLLVLHLLHFLIILSNPKKQKTGKEKKRNTDQANKQKHTQQ
jgi:quinol-cytochrome oxidoreductase complex cytochrome b subunit